MPKRRIGIIGHGYVGRAMEQLFRVAYDVDVFDTAHQPDWSRVAGADLHVVCVPTPEGRGGRADISAVKASVLRSEAPFVLIKSTVPPGTTSELQGLLASRANGKPYSTLGFSPEYLGEGRSYVAPWLFPDAKDARSHDYHIVGSGNAYSFLDFLAPVVAAHARLVATDSVTAELAKYMENSFLAMKVVFCAEWAQIAERWGVSYHELRHLWTLDPRMGSTHTKVFRDAPGYGGKCLPKDMAAILAAVKDKCFHAPLLEAVHRVNAELREGLEQVNGEAKPTMALRRRKANGPRASQHNPG